MISVKSRAPVRVSFSGGGTDVPPFSEEYGGCVVSATIDKYIRVDITSANIPDAHIISAIDLEKREILPLRSKFEYSATDPSQNPKLDLIKAVLNELKPAQSLDIYIHGNTPAGSGLGTSSAAAVAMIAACYKLSGQTLDKKKIAEEAIRIEKEVLKRAGGFQDQYASSFGGFNYIEFLPGGVRNAIPLSLTKQFKDQLLGHLKLFFLGGEHSSGDQQQKLIQSMKTNEDTVEALKEFKTITQKMKTTLESQNLKEFGLLLHESWKLKKRSSPSISNSLIDSYYNSAMSLGAVGGKLLGAGGTGYLLLFIPPEKYDVVAKEMVRNGAKELDFGFDEEGVVVT